MQYSALPPELQERLLAARDIVQREQLMDFLKQRMFRQALLCHAGLSVDPDPRLARAARLAAAGPIDHETDVSTGRVTFTGSAGATVTTDHELLVDALMRIGERWPAAVWLHELGTEQLVPPHERAVLCEALVRCFQANLVRLHAHPPPAATTPGERPLASPLARMQARDRDYMTTLRHTTIRLERTSSAGSCRAARRHARSRGAAGRARGAPRGRAYPGLAADLKRSLDTLASIALLMPRD